MAAAEPDRHDVIAIGASAGGVEALRRLFSLLPADLDAIIAVVLHLSPTAVSALPAILGRAAPFPVLSAAANTVLDRGRAYVAVPDQHLILEDHALRLTRGAREHFHRPAVDPLFRSAAELYGRRVVGVVLSGAGSDGAIGAIAIKAAGGLVLAQDPSEAIHESMPRATIDRKVADAVLPIEGLAEALRRLAAGEPLG